MLVRHLDMYISVVIYKNWNQAGYGRMVTFVKECIWDSSYCVAIVLSDEMYLLL